VGKNSDGNCNAALGNNVGETETKGTAIVNVRHGEDIKGQRLAIIENEKWNGLLKGAIGDLGTSRLLVVLFGLHGLEDRRRCQVDNEKCYEREASLSQTRASKKKLYQLSRSRV
jgi:hypothetical protein